MITVTFYPLDVERYGNKFTREFPDEKTWRRVRAHLTGTYHRIEVSYPPDGSNYHDHLCRCPSCNAEPPDNA